MNIKDLNPEEVQIVPLQQNNTPTKKKLNIKDLDPKQVKVVSSSDIKGLNNAPLLTKTIAPENINNPTFEYTANDSTLGNVAKAVGNVPKSVWNIGKGLFTAVRHPVETVKNVGNLIKGAGGAVGEKLLENTKVGQRVLSEANKSRIARGLAPLNTDEKGRLQAEDTQELSQAKVVGGYLKDRYGSVEGLKRTAVEDPAGIALDVSALFTGGSTIAPKVAKVAEVSGMARTANVIRKVGTASGKIGTAIDPIQQSAKILKPVVTRKIGDVKNFIGKSGKELQSEALKEGLYGMNETIGTLKNKFADTSYKYKTPAGDIVDVNPIDTLVQYDLIPQPAKGGSLDVTKIKTKIPQLKADLESQIGDVLKTSDKTITIDQYANELENSIEALNKSKLYKTELAEKIQKELENLDKAYPDGQIPMDEINKIRKEANMEYRDDKIDMARIKGNATREMVYNTTDDMVVKDLLNEQRKLINAEDYATKLAIHKVKGGRLGNYVYTTLGAIIGGATKAPFGIGETIGAVGGRALSELIQRRQLRSVSADVKAGLEKLTGKKLTADVSGGNKGDGLGKIFGQKSPNTNPANNTPNTMASIEESISKKKVNVKPDEHGTPVNMDNGSLGDPTDEAVFYHGTTTENKPSLLKEGFNIKSNKKGFAEQPEAFYISDKNEAGMYGKDIVGVRVKKGQTIKTLQVTSKEWADTVGKSRGADETAQYLRDLRAKGYDAINSGDEIEVLNPSKFEVFDPENSGVIKRQASFSERLKEARQTMSDERIYNDAKNTTFKEFVKKYEGYNLDKGGMSDGSIPAHATVSKYDLYPTEADSWDTFKTDTTEKFSKEKMATELKKYEKDFGPVLVEKDGDNYYVTDGHHRTKNLLSNGEEEIPVYFDRRTLQKIWEKENGKKISIEESKKIYRELFPEMK